MHQSNELRLNYRRRKYCCKPQISQLCTCVQLLSTPANCPFIATQQYSHNARQDPAIKHIGHYCGHLSILGCSVCARRMRSLVSDCVCRWFWEGKRSGYVCSSSVCVFLHWQMDLCVCVCVRARGEAVGTAGGLLCYCPTQTI